MFIQITRNSISFRGVGLGCFAGLVTLLSGCGAGLGGAAERRVDPVRGRIVHENGKAPWGGCATFVSQDSLSSSRAIDLDGLIEPNSSDVVEGAPTGEDRVRIEPPAATATVRRRGRLPFASHDFNENHPGPRATVNGGENPLEPFRVTTPAASPAAIAVES